MSLFKYLLIPFSWLFDFATRIRNYLFDIGHKKSFRFDTMVISVGNLNVGGSGKTPMIEYLIRLLSDRYRVATLSRGYGRSTRGVRIASANDNARSIGDEPYQLMRKFENKISVAVGEERALAIPTILNECTEVNVILLDDAFQHRTVIPQLSILVTDHEKPFYKDYLLPFGRLREARKGAKRADIIVVTKCKELNQNNRDIIRQEIQKITGPKPVFFSALSFQAPRPIGHTEAITKKVVVVSGIAKNDAFAATVTSQYEMHHHFRFADHHRYTAEDIKKINSVVSQAGSLAIVTTEKDMVKLIAPDLKPHLEEHPWFYLPVETIFLENGSDFDARVITEVENMVELVRRSSEIPEEGINL